MWLIWKNVNQTTNELSINNDDSINLPTKFTENSDMNLPNMTDLKKIYQTTNVFIINNADLTNLSTKFIEKQWYEFTKCDWFEKNDQNIIKNKDDSTNLPTMFIENSDMNLPNVIDLKKIDQTHNAFIIKRADLTNLYLPSLHNSVIQTYQMWLIWRKLINLPMNLP